MKHKLLSLLGILALTFAFFSCSADVGESEPQPTYYTVTYSSEYGTAPVAISVEENTTLSETQLPVLYADNAVFEGWYDGETKAVAGVYQVKGTVTLTAHWVFSVTYTSEHGTAPETIIVEKNTVLSEIQLPTLSDGALVFKGWFDGATKAVAGEYQVTRNLTLTAHWAATATVSYHSKFGTVPESFDVELNQTLTAGNLTTISCSPYIFLGWYYSKDENNNGSGTQAQSGDEITADTPLYAKWKTARVSFHSNFGTVPESFVTELNQMLSAGNLSAISCSPYTFLGWYYSKDENNNGCGTQAQAGDSVTDDIHLYAKWKTATVSFTTAYGAAPSIEKYTGEKFSETEIPNLGARTGYSFDGWFNGSTRIWCGYTVNGDVTFTAKWTAKKYTITFNSNRGAVSGESETKQTVAFETTVKLNANTFNRYGYTFNGWNNAADGSGTAYADEADFTMTEANGVTLYAQWTPNEYTITFNANGGTGSDYTQTVSTGTTVKLKVNTFTKQDYFFFGWSTSQNSSQRRYSDGDNFTSAGGNITLYAIWQDVVQYIIVPQIKNMTESGTIVVTGEINNRDIAAIKQALYTLKSNNSSIKVSLDLSGTTGITSLDNESFKDCSNLNGITLPNTVTSIGNSAFYGCSGLTGSLTIPDSVTSIGDSAFSRCSGLTSITIPSGVTSIEGYAFYGCSGLMSIIIPNGVTVIGDSTFRGCSGLTSITIPDSVTSIGKYAFEGCSGLTSIIIPNGVTVIGDSTFSGCSGLTSIEIPNGVTKIWHYAFEGCSGLTGNLTIPDSVTYIGIGVFKGCSGLTTIAIPDIEDAFGNYMLEGCSSLTTITIPSKATAIGHSAFKGCCSLTSITIPDSITFICKNAFEGCSRLTSVFFSDTESIWCYAPRGGTIGKMSNPSTNATLLTTTYMDYYLNKQ